MPASPLAGEPSRSVSKTARLRGEPRLPGDKSISHRALLLARPGRGPQPDLRSRRRTRRPGHGRDRGRARGDRGAGPRGRPQRRLPGRLAGRGRPPRGRGRARLPQLRDEPAALLRRAGRPAVLLDPGRRRFVAEPSGGPYHRTAALDGRGSVRPPFRFPPTAGRDRSFAASPRSTTRPRVPSAQVKSAILLAGLRAEGHDHGARGGRHARPHRADAAGARRSTSGASRRRVGRRSGGLELWRAERDSRGRSTSASRPIRRPPPSGWSPGRSTPTPS